MNVFLKEVEESWYKATFLLNQKEILYPEWGYYMKMKV